MPWYNSYFKKSWLLMQSTVKAQENTLLEADFIQSFLLGQNHHKILDVPCSTGRIAIELSARGFDTTALDFNGELLEIGKKEAAERETQVRWVEGDMRDLPFEAGSFDAVLCVFNSFGYFEETENEAFLQSAAKVLKPGGMLLLDLHVLETLLPVFSEKGFWRLDDCIILEERSFNFETSRMEGEWTTINEGKTTKSTSSVRIYSYLELTRLLTKCGFGNFKAFGDYYGEEFEFGYDQLVLLAERI